MIPVTFTHREQQIIRLLAAGYASPAIARELGIGRRTVKSYTDRLRLMLNVQTLRELPVAYMAATGDDPFPRPGEGTA